METCVSTKNFRDNFGPKTIQRSDFLSYLCSMQVAAGVVYLVLAWFLGHYLTSGAGEGKSLRNIFQVEAISSMLSKVRSKLLNNINNNDRLDAESSNDLSEIEKRELGDYLGAEKDASARLKCVSIMIGFRSFVIFT